MTLDLSWLILIKVVRYASIATSLIMPVGCDEVGMPQKMATLINVSRVECLYMYLCLNVHFSIYKGLLVVVKH